MIEEQKLDPEELVTFGDGFVEIELTTKLGGYAGADMIIPHFEGTDAILKHCTYKNKKTQAFCGKTVKRLFFYNSIQSFVSLSYSYSTLFCSSYASRTSSLSSKVIL